MKKITRLMLIALTLVCSSCSQLILLHEDDIKQQIKTEITMIDYSINKSKVYIENSSLMDLMSLVYEGRGFDEFMVSQYDEARFVFADVYANISESDLKNNKLTFADIIDKSFNDLISDSRYSKRKIAKEVYSIYKNTVVILSEFKQINDDTWEVVELQTGIKFYVQFNDDAIITCVADEKSVGVYGEKLLY